MEPTRLYIYRNANKNTFTSNQQLKYTVFQQEVFTLFLVIFHLTKHFGVSIEMKSTYILQINKLNKFQHQKDKLSYNGKKATTLNQCSNYTDHIFIISQRIFGV
jgi:hypothetical protein